MDRMGFEPTTPSMPWRCAAGLRYRPEAHDGDRRAAGERTPDATTVRTVVSTRRAPSAGADRSGRYPPAEPADEACTDHDRDLRAPGRS